MKGALLVTTSAVLLSHCCTTTALVTSSFAKRATAVSTVTRTTPSAFGAHHQAAFVATDRGASSSSSSLSLLRQNPTFFITSRDRTASSTTSSRSSSSSLSMSATAADNTNTNNQEYTLADQVARFARAKRENNQRYLNIDSVYDPSFLKGLRVAVTGANRGIGLALAKELTLAGAHVVALVRSTSPELQELSPAQIIEGVDVQNDVTTAQLNAQITGGPIDILINNAGYFRVEVEKLDRLDFADQLKTIDICACGPLRVTAALVNGGLLRAGAKVIMITSQGGSVSWRTVQNPNGGDYGHHMSKAAANMMSALLAQEVKPNGIAVGIFHPGFNKTGMTAKYQEIWEVEGAVDPAIGAKRILYETGRLSMATTGKFINCEDGLEIPF